MGCVRDVCANHARTHTRLACQRGGSLVPSHPPSEPSSPSSPLQLHPGQQHQPPEQVTSPPCQHWVSRGQAVTDSQREGATCQGVKIPGGGIGVLVGELGRAVVYPVGRELPHHSCPGVPYPQCNGGQDRYVLAPHLSLPWCCPFCLPAMQIPPGTVQLAAGESHCPSSSASSWEPFSACSWPSWLCKAPGLGVEVGPFPEVLGQDATWQGQGCCWVSVSGTGRAGGTSVCCLLSHILSH